jgi:hypothetical protein
MWQAYNCPNQVQLIVERTLAEHHNNVHKPHMANKIEHMASKQLSQPNSIDS